VACHAGWDKADHPGPVVRGRPPFPLWGAPPSWIHLPLGRLYVKPYAV